MPLYEYRCKKCDKSFEILHKSNEKAVCPECGGKSMEKLFSVFASGGSSDSSLNGTGPSSSPGCSSGGCGCGMNM
ncbi:MAG: zinc ribbon domain-containing protein [Candidatus Scalindua sp.]|nr:zinc ribbon domain-containing protein [Candidatus Scalindua sp.]